MRPVDEEKGSEFSGFGKGGMGKGKDGGKGKGKDGDNGKGKGKGKGEGKGEDKVGAPTARVHEAPSAGLTSS